MKRDLFEIALEMRSVGLPDAFVARCLSLAHEYRGIADLMALWSQEDGDERSEIVADLDALIVDLERPADRGDRRPVRFDDLDSIAANVMAFKDRLRLEVDKRTTLTELADKTGMPLPSLSRFFSQPSMPRRATLLKIAHALDLSELDIASEWSV